MEEAVGKQWYKHTSLQQALVLLISILFGVNGYKGPVFDNWYGDLIALSIMVVIYYNIRKLDYQHQEHDKDVELRICETRLDIAKIEAGKI